MKKKYRLLKKNIDHIQIGDEFLGLNGKTWKKFEDGIHIGRLYTDEYVPCRRKIISKPKRKPAK